MTKKQELYYMLNAFIRGEYKISTFCKVFEDIFYPDVYYNEEEVRAAIEIAYAELIEHKHAK